VAGVTDWGREAPLAPAIQVTDDCELAAAAMPRGKTRGDIAIVGSVRKALAVPWEVRVDYTSAAAARENVFAAIAGDRHVVVWSSGLNNRDYDEIDRPREPLTSACSRSATSGLPRSFNDSRSRRRPSQDHCKASCARHAFQFAT
jgi:dihydrodipicolinate reductase